jgi:hypothetical protein
MLWNQKPQNCSAPPKEAGQPGGSGNSLGKLGNGTKWQVVSKKKSQSKQEQEMGKRASKGKKWATSASCPACPTLPESLLVASNHWWTPGPAAMPPT